MRGRFRGRERIESFYVQDPQLLATTAIYKFVLQLKCPTEGFIYVERLNLHSFCDCYIKYSVNVSLLVTSIIIDSCITLHALKVKAEIAVWKLGLERR